jgi:hypothetical protein
MASAGGEVVGTNTYDTFLQLALRGQRAGSLPSAARLACIRHAAPSVAASQYSWAASFQCAVTRSKVES